MNVNTQQKIFRAHEAVRSKAAAAKGYIFNIQRYSVQDGPGIRSTVFFKGCPLRCLWCSNPESQEHFPEVAISHSLCNNCGNCLKVCERGAITNVDAGIKIDRRLCTNCFKCVPVCIPGAISVYGSEASTDEVMEEVERDRPYYWRSGGGVTASGGEPLSQGDFLTELFQSCQKKGIHTTLDTSGCANSGVLAKVLEYTDLVLYDLKHMDSSTHLKLTGMANELIIENARLIVSRGIPIIFRIPLILDYNDSDDNIRACAEFAVELGASEVDLLPYHRYGVNKYRKLDRKYELDELVSAADKQVERPKQIIEGYGMACVVGG